MPVRLIALLACLVSLAAPAGAAATKPRPMAGDGILIIRRPPIRLPGEPLTFPVYREPGVERIADLDISDLPQLAPAVRVGAGEAVAATVARRGDWLKIVYDDAGREGWVKPERIWFHDRWEDFLKGQTVRLLPGLKKGYYSLRREPAQNAPELDNLARRKYIRVIQVQGDWALVIVDLAESGWLRWRDEDRRFLIAVEVPSSPQKR